MTPIFAKVNTVQHNLEEFTLDVNYSVSLYKSINFSKLCFIHMTKIWFCIEKDKYLKVGIAQCHNSSSSQKLEFKKISVSTSSEKENA